MKTLILSLILVVFASLTFSQAKRDDKKAAPQSAPSQKSNEGVIWGQTFADYAYAAQSNDPAQKGANAFVFRRIYLGYDQDISEHFSTRVLLSADNGDTAKSGAMDFTAQEIYLEWKNLLPLSSMYFGLSATPSIGLAEKLWGYRSLEKVILDRNGLVAIDDMGIGVGGKLAQDGSSGYAVLIANGQGVKLENDKLKKIYGECYGTPMKNSIGELYADFENGANAESKFTGKVLLGYQVPSVSAGVEGFYRTVHNGAVNIVPVADSALAGGSAYASFQIVENVRGVLRGDYFDANASQKTIGVREFFSLLGVDYSPLQDVHVIPNALYTHRMYKVSPAPGPALVDDVTIRLTFAYSFAGRI